MIKYKRITSFFLSLSLIAGIVQQPVSALNKSPSSPEETIEIVNADGSIIDAPILNDEETIELLNEEVEAEEYTASDNEYWNMVYNETKDCVDNSYGLSRIKLSGGGGVSLFREEYNLISRANDDYYLYSLYKPRTIKIPFSYNNGNDETTGYYGQLFYTRLPYQKNEFTHSDYQVVDGIPNTIAETYAMRGYSMEEIIKKDNRYWINRPSSWGEYETNWAPYGFTYPMKGNFAYPFNGTNYTSSNLKDAVGPLSSDNFRLANEQDPAAFLYYDKLAGSGHSPYLIPRSVKNAINFADMIPISFPQDTAKGAKKDTLYEVDQMMKYPWKHAGHGADSGAGNVTLPYNGTLNENWMKKDGSWKENNLNTSTLKSVVFTPEEYAAIASLFDDTMAEELAFSKDSLPSSDVMFWYLDDEDDSDPGFQKNIQLLLGTAKTVDMIIDKANGAEITYTPDGTTEALPEDKSLHNLYFKTSAPLNSFTVNKMSLYPGPLPSDSIQQIFNTLVATGLNEDEALKKTMGYYNAHWTAKALYLLQYMCFNNGCYGFETEIPNGEFGVFANVSFGRNNGINYNSVNLPILYSPTVINFTPAPALTRNLALTGTYEAVEATSSIDSEWLEEWHKPNLYKVRDEISDTEFKNIVGVSKEDFNKISSTMLGDNDVKNTNSNYDYGRTNLGNISKENFEKCFVALTKDDSVMPDTTYVLQAGVYQYAEVKSLDENIPIEELYINSYNDNIYLGWSIGENSEGTKGRHLPDYEMNDMTKAGASDHFMLPQAFNTKSLLDPDPNGEALEKISTSSTIWRAQEIAEYKNRLNVMATADGYIDWATIEDVTGFTLNIYHPANATNDEYVIEDGTERNINLYRGFVHTPNENSLGDKNGLFNIDVFLYDPNSSHSYASQNVYTVDTQAGKYENLVEIIYDAYKVAALKVAENNESLLSALNNLLNNITDINSKKAAINRFINICGQVEMHKALDNTTLNWMINPYFYSVDNNSSFDDQIQLSYPIQKPPTDKQTNLRVKYVTIYGKPAGSTEEWKEIFRTVDLESFKQPDGKYVIDLPALGQEFNVSMNYVVCYGQQFDSLMDKDVYTALDAATKEDVSKSSTGNLYMYGYIQSIGSRDDPQNKTTLDYLHGASSINDPWVDNNVDVHLDQEGTWRTCTKPADSVVNNWTASYSEDTANRVLSGKYYNELMGSGDSRVKHKADGTAYIADTYVLGVDPAWSSHSESEDKLNDNTVKPLTCNEPNPEIHCADPETVYIKYQFGNGKDFDNKITDIYLIDREGNRIDTTEDCFAPGKITDIDINSSDPYFSMESSLADHSYSLVVKVERNITGKEHKDIGSQCELTFVGNMFGMEYTETDPLVLGLANGAGNITNDKHHISNPTSNSGNTLAKNGDYITYYVNGLLPIDDTEICGTFIFKHREEDGTLSTNDMNMLNNYKKGAVNWGPLDYIVSNLVIWPDVLYFDEDQVWLPESGDDDLVSFTCNVEAQYTSPDGSRPIINNEKLWTNFTIYRERRPKNSGSDYTPDGCVYRIDNMKLTINGPIVTVTGKFRAGRAYENTDSNLRSEGFALSYNKENDYRFVARINGGNGVSEHSTIHEYPADQKIKLETVRTNNKDIAELPMLAAPPDDEPLCESPHVRNDWSITFHWRECPTPHYYTCCSGKPQSCRTCCTGTGCHSWTGDKSYWETYKMSGYVRSTANGWKWEPLGSSIELRAGQKFQISIHSDYNNNRAELPPPEPYGGCTWRSRSPGTNYTSAYRYIRVMIKNTANSQFWKRTSNRSGWHQELESPEFTVPEDTKNLTITVKAETQPFYGVREKGNQKLCTNLNTSVKVSAPLPIAEGNTQIY